MRGVSVKNSCETNDRAQPVVTQCIHRPLFNILGKTRLDYGMLSALVTVGKSITTIAWGLAKNNHTTVDSYIATWRMNHNNDRDEKGMTTTDTQTGGKTPCE